MIKSIIFLLSALILLFFFPAKAQNVAGYEWGNVKIGGGGFVTGIITCPTQENLIYARTDVGGAYRWHEDTQGWKPLLDWNNSSQTSFQGVEALAIDPQEPNRLYLSVGTDYWNSGISAILCSDDYGATFKVVNVTNLFKVHGNGMGRQNGERLSVDPNKGSVLLCGSRANGLFKSENHGASWFKVTTFPLMPTGALSSTNGIATVVFDKESSVQDEATRRIFVGVSRTGSDNLYVSNDAGETWLAVENAIKTHMPQRMLIANGNLFVAYADKSGPWDPSSGRLMKYNIELKEWTNISPSDNPIGGVTVDASNPDIIMASTINTWRQQFWRPGNAVWGDRIFRSTDGGKSWTDLFEKRKMSLNQNGLWDSSMALHWVGDIQIDPFNPNRVFAISGNGIFMSNNITATDDGIGIANWYLQCNGLEETVPLNLVSIPNEALISVIGDYDGFKHTNVFETPKRHTPSVGTSTGIDFAQRNNKFVVRSGGNEASNGIFYSLNAGTTWTAFKTKPTTTSHKGHVAVSADGSLVLWKPEGANNTYFTADKGETWSLAAASVITTRSFSDRVNSKLFYTVSGTTLKVLTFNGTNQKFDITNVNINATGREIIRPVPRREGEVWIACGNQGIRRYFHLENSTKSITSVRSCEGIGFGKAPEGKGFPAVFIWGNVNGVVGAFRSDDEGESWIRINDDQHQYGALGNGQFIMGDANVFGRVYMSSVGRGIVMGYLPDQEYMQVEEDTIDTSSENLNKKSFNIRNRVFSGQLYLEVDKPAQYCIYNLLGVLVEQGDINMNAYVGKALQNGMYLLEVKDNNFLQTVRIVKRK